MSTRLVRVNYKTRGITVNTLAIRGQFLETGEVGRHAKHVGRSIRREAEFMAPVRAGDLKTSHTGPYYSRTTLGGHCTIGNTAPYAKFVHDGTHGPIFPRNPTGYLYIRPSPHSWFAETELLPHVRGQRSQPWMERAMEMVINITYHR